MQRGSKHCRVSARMNVLLKRMSPTRGTGRHTYQTRTDSFQWSVAISKSMSGLLRSLIASERYEGRDPSASAGMVYKQSEQASAVWPSKDAVPGLSKSFIKRSGPF